MLCAALLSKVQCIEFRNTYYEELGGIARKRATKEQALMQTRTLETMIRLTLPVVRLLVPVVSQSRFWPFPTAAFQGL